MYSWYDFDVDRLGLLSFDQVRAHMIVLGYIAEPEAAIDEVVLQMLNMGAPVGAQQVSVWDYIKKYLADNYDQHVVVPDWAVIPKLSASASSASSSKNASSALRVWRSMRRSRCTRYQLLVPS